MYYNKFIKFAYDNYTLPFAPDRIFSYLFYDYSDQEKLYTTASMNNAPAGKVVNTPPPPGNVFALDGETTSV